MTVNALVSLLDCWVNVTDVGANEFIQRSFFNQ
jgi:hypothetical protein